MLKVKASKLVEAIWPLVRADIPVFIQGLTGVGKSAMMRNDLMPLARREWGECHLHDHRLSSKDITDGTGIPVVDQESFSTRWTRPAFIPFDDGAMHIMFLDEIGHASIQMQHAVGYQLVWDRALGLYKLPKKNRVILAYNTAVDKGGDNKLAKPFENRGAHVRVELDNAGWLEWGKGPGNIDSRLLAFIKVRPAMLHKMDENNPAWPSPRSLENFNRAMVSAKSRNEIENAALAICGEAFSANFMQFLRDLDAALPKLADIRANPTGAKVPAEMHHQVLIAASIAHTIGETGTDIKAWTTYLKRLSAEVASHAAHTAMEKNKALVDEPLLKKLILAD